MTEKSFQNVFLLYLMYFFFSFVSRLWQIGIILLIAKLTYNSLFYIGMNGLLSTSFILLFSSFLGKWFDNNNRLYCISIVIFIEVCLVTIAYSLCSNLLTLNNQNENEKNEIQNVNQIYFIIVICAIADLSFSLITMNIEKDWIVVLSNNNSEWLSKTNSTMTQIDLACDSFAPIVAGGLFSIFSYSIVAIILLTLNGLASLFLYIFLYRLYYSWSALSTKASSNVLILTDEELLDNSLASPPSYYSSKNSNSNNNNNNNDNNKNNKVTHQIQQATFFTSGCSGAMISYSCLYFTVLSFSSLMLVYLKWSGIPDHWIGISRGLAAVSGFIGAWIYPYVTQSIGIVFTAKISIWWQTTFVIFAALGVAFSSRELGSIIMIIIVLFSRIGLWSFDLCIRQIAQETIPESSRGVVNGTWNSLTSFFDMLTYVVAIIFSNPEQFGLLINISATMVSLACIIFTWTNSPPLCGNNEYEIIQDNIS